MANTQVGKLHKKSIVRGLDGGIRDMRDEANGGWIVRGGSVVNQEKWGEYCKMLKDKEDSAKALAQPKIREDYSETKDATPEPSRVDKLEEKVEALDSKLDAILKAVSK